MAVGQHNEARIYGVFGASGSGKSLYVKTVLLKPKPPRLAVWNYQHEEGYTGICGTSTGSLKELANSCKKPRFAVDFRPNLQGDLDKQFDLFCRIVHATPDIAIVIEEMSFVTKPSYAPPSWRAICATGRHTGMLVIGLAQRPVMVDKTFFSQCTTIRTGRLNFLGDQKIMADVLNVTAADVGALKPLEYIERTMTTGEVSRGRVKIPASLRK
jgi:hypothetical protein